MYEHQTYEVILNRMKDRVPTNIDKREGSIIHDALAPAAAELAQLYMALDINNNLSYADTASGEYLARRAAEFGVNRLPASKARRRGLFYGDDDMPIDVLIGSRFSIGGLTYSAISQIATGEFVLECETEGIAGNQQFGTLLPIDYVNGLVRAELSNILVPGEDEEPDEQLRERYYEAVNEPSFGGNIADYRQHINNIPGVGGVKISPTWQGGGTVKCTIIASDYNPPTTELIGEVQTVIDPVVNQGEGLGLAPIGHTVTIAGVSDEVINLETTVSLEAGMTVGQVQADIEETYEEYLLSLRRNWATEEKIVVRIAQIDARILTVPGVVDVTDTKLNDFPMNIELTLEEIPRNGTVIVNE